jgi:RNA polymerase sigma factor (sigma-70 family)
MTRAELRKIVAAVKKDRVLGEEWILRYQAKDPLAAEVLVRAHNGLVRFVSLKYSRPHFRDWDDCMQEGRMGLLRGARDWKPGLSPSPATYLAIWIRHHVQRFLTNAGQGVRIPVHHYTKQRGEERAKDSIARPRTRTFTELASHSPQEDVPAFEDVLVADGPGADDDLSEHEFEMAVPRLALWFLSKCATSERRNVLLRRFLSEPAETLQQIGESRGVSREWIRLVEKAALEGCRDAALKSGFPIDRSSTFEAWVCAAADSLGFGARDELHGAAA